MSYSKYFYVERALQQFNFTLKESDRIANLVIPFAAFVAKKNGMSLSLSVAEVLASKDVPEAVKEFINGEGADWGKSSLETFEKVSTDDIKLFISDKIILANEKLGFKDGVINLPSSVNILSALILAINAEDSVLDLGAGFGSFLTHVAKNYSYKKLEGIEINKKTWLYGSMLTYLEDANPVLKLGDALQLKGKKYDKQLAFPPVGIDMEIPFIKKILELLSDNGRAVVFLTQGLLFNEGHGLKDIRKFLIDNGYLESVIEFHGGVLLPYTAVNTALLVLSKNNKSVRIVDASSYYENTRRGISVLTEEAAKSIYQLLKEDNDISRQISNDEIKAKDYMLSSRTYFLEEKIKLPGVRNYAKLSDLVETKILRGAQIKASDLEELESEEDTGNYYALAKDIQDNRLGGELKLLKQIDKKLESLILKDGDILLVMVVSDTLKLACIDGLENRKIIPASNLYIIRPNKNKLEPLYLKMLLETDTAAQIFNAFSGGTALRAVSADFLNKLQIPVPPIEVQKKLAEKYAGIETQREQLKKQLEALADQKSRILDDLKESNP